MQHNLHKLEDRLLIFQTGFYINRKQKELLIFQMCVLACHVGQRICVLQTVTGKDVSVLLGTVLAGSAAVLVSILTSYLSYLSFAI